MAAPSFPNAPLTVKLIGWGNDLHVEDMSFNPGMAASDDPGTPLNLLVDTGSDITWVAKKGFTAMTGQTPLHRIPNPLEDSQCIDTTIRIPPGTAAQDTHRWGAIYTPGFGASGTTRPIINMGIGTYQTPLAIGIADQASIAGRGRYPVQNGILGLGITSTTTSWPGDNGPYLPLWLQLLSKSPLAKTFSIALDRTKLRPDDYTGTLTLGRLPNTPFPSNAITIPLHYAPSPSPPHWSVRVQLYARVTTPPASPTQKETIVETLLGNNPIEIVLDTGADRVWLPQDIANHYNGHLNGMSPSAAPGFTPQKGPLFPAQAPILQGSRDPVFDVALVVRFVDAKTKDATVVIPAGRLVEPDQSGQAFGHGRVMGTGGMPLLGMPFFLAAGEVVFDKGGECVVVVPS
ncbi:aspartic peptidase domain-containing protein [Immersiella caudata]|uniref:Aspartic peptidase domain-containing protein n=1 Tax=Immersiella caudata TaxID=314043 RepID=A0AA39WJH1_9PEZI|nr:aspartic peptidase domain-containing protein [Immersiella caudata]